MVIFRDCCSIGSFAIINKFLQISASGFLVFYDLVTKSTQNILTFWQTLHTQCWNITEYQRRQVWNVQLHCNGHCKLFHCQIWIYIDLQLVATSFFGILDLIINTGFGPVNSPINRTFILWIVYKSLIRYDVKRIANSWEILLLTYTQLHLSPCKMNYNQLQ